MAILNLNEHQMGGLLYFTAVQQWSATDQWQLAKKALLGP